MSVPEKSLVPTVIALVLGAIGLNLVFSDSGDGESASIYFTMITLFNLLCGFGFGLLMPRSWFIAVFCAWGTVLFGGLLILLALRKYGSAAFAASDPPYITSGLFILFVPLCSTILGAYIGKVSSRKPASI